MDSKKYRVTFKPCALLIVEMYVWVLILGITYGIAAPIAIWRIFTALASKAVIREDHSQE